MSDHKHFQERLTSSSDETVMAAHDRLRNLSKQEFLDGVPLAVFGGLAVHHGLVCMMLDGASPEVLESTFKTLIAIARMEAWATTQKELLRRGEQ